MKFSILKENFNKALSTVSRTIPIRPPLPILNNILLKAENNELKIIATNLETGIIVSMGAKIEKQGEVSVPGKLVTEFVSSLPAEKIEVILDKEILHIKTQKTTASFNTLPAKEYPPLPSVKEKADLNFGLKQLGSSVGKTAFAASLDEGRPILTGVKVKIAGGKLYFYATDGYRLSMSQEKISSSFKEEMELVFPAKTLVEVVRIASEENQEEVGLSLVKEKNQAIFSTERTYVMTRLIDGEFPNIEKIIPSMFKTKVTFDTEKLLQSVKIASLFARGASNIIKLQIKKDGVWLSANTPQVGEDQDFVDAKVEGEDSDIAFNYRFLLDLLNNFSDKQIVFESSGPLNPGVFKPASSDSSFLHIIMPVRLQG